MTLEQKPFVKYNLDDKQDTFTIRLNTEQRIWFNEDKNLLKQMKDSTAIKQLAELGHYVLHDTLTGKIVKLILENKRKNSRVGVNEYDEP